MNKAPRRRSIFRSLFVPLIIVMILQAIIFYTAAVYGGIEESLTRNAVDILAGRLNSREQEMESAFNSRWTDLDDCISSLNDQYAQLEVEYGGKPLCGDNRRCIDFLVESADTLVDTLRYTQTNGVFLIINDRPDRAEFSPGGEQKYGLSIRDMDQNSSYTGREDLVIERAPSSAVERLGCSLDSWWEAKYSFSDSAAGDYYYEPLRACYSYPGADSCDLAYLSGGHCVSGSDPKVVSYSVPLISDNGYPYAVLGIELTVSYLELQLPNTELGDANRTSYILALKNAQTGLLEPILGTGALFSRCFGTDAEIDLGSEDSEGGFALTGRTDTALYAVAGYLDIFNSNSPFGSEKLVLLAVSERADLFSYISHIKFWLMSVSLLSLLLGFVGLVLTSRNFAAPITALARRVRAMDSVTGQSLGRLGISEIDQLVDSIEELDKNVSRNSARTEFFSRMSHDMRTPMNAIISFSSKELLENADESVKDDYLSKIHASGEYLLGLINEVLDMTKIESNKISLNLESTQARALFDTTVPVIEKLAQKRNIAFSMSLDIDPELWVLADKLHINQIVMNLLSNAVKFTPENGSVSFAAGMSAARPGLCRIEVADTGIGMSEEFQKNLYKPFEQESTRHEGTGLGLSIAKKLVELMDGSIECKSKKDVGTTFTVELPLSVADAVPRDSAAAAEKDMSALAGKRVLICEDNSINMMIIRQLLERADIRVEIAENGKIGLEMFEKSPEDYYDAVLMDIRMPVMDGLETTVAIRSLPRKDAVAVPIIAMTANAFDEDANSSREAGMNEHLSKPVQPQVLYEALLKFIK